MGSETVKHHFVLVHGAWHGAWCWVKLVAELEKAGHQVTTIDLLGAGNNREKAVKDIASPEEYDGPLEKLFESFPDDEKVVAVGHSLGGMSIARMSEKFPNKISLAVYLAGVMPVLDFQVLAQLVEEFHPFRSKVGFEALNDGGPSKVVKLKPAVVGEIFYNKCSSEDVAFAVERVGLMNDVCNLPPTYLTQENYGSVPRVYIMAREDEIVVPKAAQIMIENNVPTECIELDGDHSLFFSNIPGVLKALTDSAAKFDRR